METPETHVRQAEELYRDDPFVTPHWYGRIIEEAQERDELEAYWAERAELEELESDEAEWAEA